MHKNWGADTKQIIQINMLRGILEPFHTPYNMGNLHPPVIDNIGKMVRRVPVFLDQDVIVEGDCCYCPVEFVFECVGDVFADVRFYADCVFLTVFYA